MTDMMHLGIIPVVRGAIAGLLEVRHWRQRQRSTLPGESPCFRDSPTASHGRDGASDLLDRISSSNAWLLPARLPRGPRQGSRRHRSWQPVLRHFAQMVSTRCSSRAGSAASSMQFSWTILPISARHEPQFVPALVQAPTASTLRQPFVLIASAIVMAPTSKQEQTVGPGSG